MDMWNWLQDYYYDGRITIESLEEVMKEDKAAKELWRDFSSNASDFIHDVRDEVAPFILYLKNRKAKGKL